MREVTTRATVQLAVDRLNHLTRQLRILGVRSEVNPNGDYRYNGFRVDEASRTDIEINVPPFRQRSNGLIAEDAGQLFICHNGRLNPRLEIGRDDLARVTQLEWTPVQRTRGNTENYLVVACLGDWDGDFPPDLQQTAAQRISRFVSACHRLKLGEGLREDYYEHHESDAETEIERQKTLGALSARPRQVEFSNGIRGVYNGRCAVTGCQTSRALQAAHIRLIPGSDDNKLSNGILLRADVHALFDAFLITLTEDGKAIEVNPTLSDPTYAFLRKAKVARPTDANAPSAENIRWHRCQFRKNLP